MIDWLQADIRKIVNEFDWKIVNVNQITYLIISKKNSFTKPGIDATSLSVSAAHTSDVNKESPPEDGTIAVV